MTYQLTEQQEHFAILIVQLQNQADAYRAAYPNFTGRNASEYGRRLLEHKGVKAKIEALTGVPLEVTRELIRSTAKVRRSKASVRERPRRPPLQLPPSGDAIMALASVVACPHVPAAHRVQTIEVLQDQLTELAAVVRVTVPSDEGEPVGELSGGPNSQTMVGSGVCRD
jgi:hypothetical protein